MMSPSLSTRFLGKEYVVVRPLTLILWSPVTAISLLAAGLVYAAVALAM